ncbi:MAG: nitrilase family protein, partial [Deltaproteobacteria bacterium]|nr:nitrilase family protein [Deltaproteobacteria bacterium]
MTKDLKVTLIQTELIWEDVELNIAGFDHQIDGMNQDTDLIILPEMFTTGFTMNA